MNRYDQVNNYRYIEQLHGVKGIEAMKIDLRGSYRILGPME